MSANYSELDLDSKLIQNLRELGHIIRFSFGGKGSQERILIMLNELESIAQRDLTEKLGIQPGSASEVIGKLESAGFIQRTPSQTDRRTADIRLTPAGRRQAEEAARQREAHRHEMFSCLSSEEKETFLALVEKLHADWDSRYCEKEKKANSQEQDCHGHRDCSGGQRCL